MPFSGGEASRMSLRLGAALLEFVEAHDLGAVTGADGEYDLTQPGDAGETALAPDAAFVRADRMPAQLSPEYKKAWRLAPDLVVEVVSPSQFRPEMAAKAKLYLKAGMRLLWMVWPRYQQVGRLAQRLGCTRRHARPRRLPRRRRCAAWLLLSPRASIPVTYTDRLKRIKDSL